jgi:hypothetical protein
MMSSKQGDNVSSRIMVVTLKAKQKPFLGKKNSYQHWLGWVCAWNPWKLFDKN